MLLRHFLRVHNCSQSDLRRYFKIIEKAIKIERMNKRMNRRIKEWIKEWIEE